MPKNRSANTANVLNQEAKKEVRRLDAALRAGVGQRPTEQDVIDAFPRFFPASHMNERQVRQYARSVIAGRPHFA